MRIKPFVNHRRGWGLPWLLIAILLLTSCGQPTPTPSPTPTKTPKAPAAQATDAATATSAVNVPAVQATDTPAPAATDTPAPPTDTPAPTDTPTPALLPGNYLDPAKDPNLAPFTGLPLSDATVRDRRPLAIKVANTANVRPQDGLSKADVVIEQRVEYNLTRFTVIYYSQGTERVGSIRSARLPDLEWPAVFDAVLCFSGGVEPVRQKLYASDFADRILEQARNGSAYFRDPNIAVPNNLFASTTTLWNVAAARGWNKRPQPALGWVFSADPPANGRGVTSIKIPYPTGTDRVEWRYDAGSGRWLRWQGGVAQNDASIGAQLSSANIVVMAANHVPTLILEHDTVDRGVNRSIEIQVWGEGPVTVYRDGQAYQGKWIRGGRQDPLRFVDGNGNLIPLKPGNTWMQLVPLDMKVTAS